MSGSLRNGFTLIELLVLLAVLGVVAAIAVPSFTTFIQSNQLITTSNDLVGALNVARSEAVRLAQPVSLIPNATFTEGYKVVTDAPADISEFQGASGSYTITLTAGVNPRFSSSGLLLSTAPTFKICRASGEDGSQINVTAGGQIRSIRFPCP